MLILLLLKFVDSDSNRSLKPTVIGLGSILAIPKIKGTVRGSILGEMSVNRTGFTPTANAKK